jgi:hypothetical protein
MDRGNEKNRTFYLSLLMNDFILHNCMLDSEASSNVMTKKVMERLNLRISRPYHNICAMDSKTIQVHGLIKGLQVHLVAFPDIMIEMDIVVIVGINVMTDNGLTHSELKSELVFLVENVSSAQPSSDESVRRENKSDGILGSHPPYFSEIGKIKDKMCDENMMKSSKDDKVNIDKVKYIIPMKRYAKPFKEKLSSETLHLAPIKNHQNFFKEDGPKWPEVRN